MTIQEELEAEAKNILLLLHPLFETNYRLNFPEKFITVFLIYFIHV